MDQTRELLKSNNKIRRKTELSSKFTKVDSPLAKYDSSGNLSCVLCRIPIKSNVWKVHLNSKQHKQFVELAKKQRIEAENTSKTSKALKTTKSDPVQEKAPITTENVIKIDAVKLHSIQSEDAPANQSSQNVLPEKFFDQEKSTNANDRDTEAEWLKFQREIREADTVSNIIVSEEQDSLNIKRHLKEIDEQMENWKRFEKINDKKNFLLKKQRKEKRPVQLDVESSSGEECSVDDLLDWRIKSVHK
ncbi:zinc finger protein 830 [Drosophila innubila]|uniref:zinc finger protein 830 n=1 Tax=Drosophila innubila TaxID=198719 RepID=UPI00148D7418|nr:zinc finger protein 830 [Drosophila innubila]